MWKEEVRHAGTKGDGRAGLGNATITSWLIGHRGPKTCDTSLTMARGRGMKMNRRKIYKWKYPKFCIGFKIRKSRCRTTLTLRFGLLKMIFECSIARCDVGLGRAIVQCQKNPLRKPKLSINRAILSAHFSAVKFCIGFFCWIGFFLVLHRLFCNWMLQLLLKIVAKNLNYASLHVCTYKLLIAVLGP